MAAGLAALLSVGCGTGPQAEFSLRESTVELIPTAQKAVKRELMDKFGTPQDLVAWQRFPVNYGGLNGTVAEIFPDGKGLAVAWDGDAAKVANGAPLLWLTGARAAGKGNVDSVGAYDATTKQLTWSGSAEPAPVAGDKFSIGFGQSLQTGRVVYMKNCMHCHGVSGDGAGPTAKYLTPLPRDYRLGIFKFTSTLNPERPTRDDLTRIVKNGIPGTYMPSFLWLGEKETESVIEYIRWLSMRGKFEEQLDNDLGNDYSQKNIEAAAVKAKVEYDAAKGGDKPKLKSAGEMKRAAAEEFAKYEKDEFPGIIEESANSVAASWTLAEAAESLVVPSVARVADDAASRERGRRLYLSDKGKCYTCHGIQGRGDGYQNEDFQKMKSGGVFAERGLHDEWGHRLQPRNLTLGQYRGGRRPVDLFRRVYAGIKGTPMPAFGKTALKDEEIWDIVNFVMSLPYQSSPPATKPADHVAASK